MFSHLKGTLIAVNASHIVLDVGGVGYAIFVPCNLFDVLPPLGSFLQIHTSFVVREFSHSLYGFLESQEKELFELLLNISGVGPKLAISLMGHLNRSQLKVAVSEGNIKTLCKVPGVGKKTAERLVVELKDKLKELFSHTPSELAISLSSPLSEMEQDAVMALVNLGYSQNASQRAVKHTLNQMEQALDLPQLITSALKHITR